MEVKPTLEGRVTPSILSYSEFCSFKRLFIALAGGGFLKRVNRDCTNQKAIQIESVHPFSNLTSFSVLHSLYLVRRGCEAPSLTAAPVRTNSSESSDSSSTHNFWGGDCKCKQRLCLSRRSHIYPKLSTRCRSI